EDVDGQIPLESNGEEPSLTIASHLLPENLLIIPLRERPLFPKMMVPVIIDNEDLKSAILAGIEDKTLEFIGLVLTKQVEGQMQPPEYPDSVEDIYTVGVGAKILRVSQSQPGTPLQILIQVMDRIEIKRWLDEDGPVFRALTTQWIESTTDSSAELKAYSAAVIDAIKELVKLNPLFKEGLSFLLERINVNDPGSLADLSASMTTASGYELQHILETRSIRTRIENTLTLLKREIEISKIKVEISGKIEERVSNQQREFFLRQQLDEIKRELGMSKDESESEIDKYQERINSLDLPEEALKRIDEEMDKLKVLNPQSPDFNVTRAYLDLLTSLPWGETSEDNYDLNEAAAVLDRDHYGLDDVKDRILELMSVGILKGDLSGSIILLVGPPGVGKTSIGKSIATALGREFFRFSVGGMRDEAEIKGHRRTYIGALPGKFIQAIKTAGTVNPVIMIDEIDKIGASFRGDPASALLEVLDPEQNREFLDHYLDVRFDLSKVLFVATANQLDTIPSPLLDRMEIIRLSGYVLEEKMEISKRYLMPKQAEAHGLEPDQVEIPDDVLKEMIDGYSREAGVRGLENNIKKVMRKSVRTIVSQEQSGEEAKVVISEGDLPKMLGRRVFSKEDLYEEPRIGVVPGLAYTSMGGAMLYIEAVTTPTDRGGFKQTGQLGSVMVESSEIAYTYVRSMLQESDFFNQNAIHLHVPSGATPKDGPSAGITMATTLYSLATNQPVRDELAMTGELTLTGMVMPIGGVKEKTIAARRAGVTDIIFPADNRVDFEELDEHVKQGITPHFATSFNDVLSVAFDSLS
ncbi:MAG: endopeptidase La, partial [Chloroflexota bacterium]